MQSQPDSPRSTDCMHIPADSDLANFTALCKKGRITHKVVDGKQDRDIDNELPTAHFRVTVENRLAGYRGHKAVWFFDVDGKIIGTGAVG